MNYGQKIAELRKNKNLTQAELGEQLNITAQAISKWENNLSEPDITSIRKMCELFNVSVDEFLGINTTKSTIEQKPQEKEPVKAILGYCETCKKPVCAGEFKTIQLEYKPSALSNKVVKTDLMHTYCNNCYNQLIETQKQEIKQSELDKLHAQKIESKKELKKGFIWGTIAMVLAAFVFFGSYATEPSSTTLVGAIIFTIGFFTLISQILWESFIYDFFFFFCRSFKAPFTLIFELSLDGIVWLLTVKLALWIICGLLSIAFFFLGLILSIFISICSFPFVLPMKIKESKI